MTKLIRILLIAIYFPLILLGIIFEFGLLAFEIGRYFADKIDLWLGE